jgi:large subunit ribosomal protein L35
MISSEKTKQAVFRSQVRIGFATCCGKCNERNSAMPKMKTKSGAAKRFKVRGSGSIKRSQAFKRHILTKKTTKSKRQLRGTAEIHATNMVSVRAMLPYA